jgi:hypothetical protein
MEQKLIVAQLVKKLPAFYGTKVTDTNHGGRVLDASARLLSRALVSQSASES